MRIFRFFDWPLYVRLLLLQGLVTVAMIGGLWGLFVYQERQLLKEMRDYIGELTKAMELSVQQFGDPRATDESLLRAYEEQLRKKGIKEINILEPDKSLLATTNPKKRKTQPFLIEERLGEKDPTRQQEHSLMPIISEGEIIGYVDLALSLEDFADEQRQRATVRMLWVGGILLVAAGLMTLIALQELRPLRELASAAPQVASGDLNVKLHGRPRRDEVGRLMRAFRRMVAALKTGRELESRLRQNEKNAMLAVMGAEIAHEIRNPLNFINLSLDHLAAKFAPQEEDRAEVENIRAQIKKEINRLTRMTEDYMALSRPRQLLVSPVSPRRLAGELAFVLAPQLAAKNLRAEVEIDESLTLAADADQLRTALLNLLANAIAAAPPGSAITFGGAADARGTVTLTVRDHGPGISAADLPRIFEPYFTTRAEGTGLGLAITRRIVMDHGGEIRVDSGAGPGTVFSLVFPPSAADAPAAGGANQPAVRIAGD